MARCGSLCLIVPRCASLCVLVCPKLQYIGKSKTQFFLRLNNHRKGAKSTSKNIIPASKHFHDSNHEFNRDAVFIIIVIEQIKNSQKTKQEKRNLLMKRENFWINKLRTMTPLSIYYVTSINFMTQQMI